MSLLPQTIDEVLAQLDQVILRARTERSRLGFFATLYRNVTIRVKEGIAAGLFEDGPRMERLDVTFANRYLDALESFRRGEPLSKCWLRCFKIANQWPPIILQHLLTGMNAHINFSLNKARESAWLVANIVNSTPAEQLPRKLRILDDGVAMLGSLIGSPNEWSVRLGLYVIRVRESNDVPRVIDVLSQV